MVPVPTAVELPSLLPLPQLLLSDQLPLLLREAVASMRQWSSVTPREQVGLLSQQDTCTNISSCTNASSLSCPAPSPTPTPTTPPSQTVTIQGRNVDVNGAVLNTNIGQSISISGLFAATKEGKSYDLPSSCFL